MPNQTKYVCAAGLEPERYPRKLPIGMLVTWRDPSKFGCWCMYTALVWLYNSTVNTEDIYRWRTNWCDSSARNSIILILDLPITNDAVLFGS